MDREEAGRESSCFEGNDRWDRGFDQRNIGCSPGSLIISVSGRDEAPGCFKEVKSVAYISGRGGDTGSGLGAFLKDRVERFSGLSIDSEFLKLPFDRQVASVADFTSKPRTGPIVANSYGAYLFVHSLIDAGEFPAGSFVLAASGFVAKEDKMFFSRPSGWER